MRDRFSGVNTVRSALFITAFSAMGLGPAQADGTVVVELYTSQGCSSCPAADKVLKKLSARPDVIALSLNVDYWDYLGWKDDLALPGNSKRQRAYSKIMRSRHVYTPQMMVDGQMDVVGSRRSGVETVVATYAQHNDAAKVSATVSGEDVSVSVAPISATGKEAVVWLVGYDSSVTKQIGGGENHGRSIEYSNVVREWRKIGLWDGASPLSLTSRRPTGQDGFAVIVQQDGVGSIVGATQVSY